MPSTRNRSNAKTAVESPEEKVRDLVDRYADAFRVFDFLEEEYERARGELMHLGATSSKGRLKSGRYLVRTKEWDEEEETHHRTYLTETRIRCKERQSLNTSAPETGKEPEEYKQWTDEKATEMMIVYG